MQDNQTETKTEGRPATLRHLGSFYRGYRHRLVLSVLSTVAQAAMVLLIPLTIGYLVDGVLRGDTTSLPRFVIDFYESFGDRAWMLGNLWLFGLIILVLYLLDGLFSSGASIFATDFAEHGALSMRQRLFSHLQRLPFSWHKKVSTGDIVQRCTSDVDEIRRFFSFQLSEMVRCVALVIVATVIMLSLDKSMALIALAPTPILFVSSAVYFQRRKDAFKRWDETEGELSTILQENVTGVRIVRAFNQTDGEIEKFGSKNDEFAAFARNQFRIMGNFWMISDFISFFQLALVVISGALFVMDGRLTLGVYIVFITYSEHLVFPLRGLARLLADAGKMFVSFGRLDEIFTAGAEPCDEDLLDPVLSGAFTLEDVSFVYDDGTREVLHDITMRVEAGESIGILGPTGSGKSTLLLLLQRLYEPTSGTIRFDGIDSRQIGRYSLRRQIGLILQEPFVYSRSIRENIRMARPDATDDDIRRHARTARFDRDVSQFEHGYDTIVGERGVTLSGGQKQRLTIARTLIRDCPILIFDDSLSAVDLETDRQIRRALAERPEAATSLIVSHRIATLMNADRIYVLDHGRIVEQGTHEELVARRGLYRRVYDIQSRWLDEEVR